MPLITNLNYPLTGLIPSSTYQVEVRAVDAAGNEGPGASATLTTADSTNNGATMNGGQIALPFGLGWNPFTSKIKIEVMAVAAADQQALFGTNAGTSQHLFVATWLGKYDVGIQGSGVYKDGKLPPKNYNTSIFQKVALEMDAGKARLYVGGEFVTAVTGADYTRLYTSYTLADNLAIGDGHSTLAGWGGRIKEAKVWVDDVLYAYYPLYTDANDYSGNNRHAAIVGGVTFS